MLRISSSQIKRNFKDAVIWHNFVRHREFEMIFDTINDSHTFEKCLELGCGDGVQSIHLSKKFQNLICTDIDMNRIRKNFQIKDISNISHVICDAENLACFPDNYFDFIFSSNMLEHVRNPEKCLAECKRVLKINGLMIFTLPNQIWKFFSFFLTFLRGSYPRIHGISKSHIEEFFYFSPGTWIRFFKKNNCRIQMMKLPVFYCGQRNKFLPLIIFGNKIGLSASNCFILRVNDITAIN